MAHNIDERVAEGFGEEWQRFDQVDMTEEEAERIFGDYFRIFPWDRLPPAPRGVDVGCGSGRWARLAARRAGHLFCVDASVQALEVAKRNLSSLDNCSLIHSSVDAMPIDDASMDFVYSLGVLHHVPDTRAAIQSCARKLKHGAPLLLYLYYRFDNRAPWFRLLWGMTEPLRWSISRTPKWLRFPICEAIAALIYWPLARLAWLVEKFGVRVNHLPLAYYRDKNFYCMRTDALDRFGTRLEQRFTRAEITAMMEAAGLERITFSDGAPFWCAVGYRRQE